MSSTKYRWWHGVAFYAGVQMAQWGMRLAVRRVRKQSERAGRESDRDAYKGQKLPVFAPPGAAFPIAWSINSVSSIAGGLHVLNLPQNAPGRDDFLRLQATAWCLFSFFNTAYFELRSPINAALVTFAYSGVTVASLAVGVGRMEDRRAAWSLATTLAWLALANPLAVTQALWNRDPFWNAGPFLVPPPGWVKSSR